MQKKDHELIWEAYNEPSEQETNYLEKLKQIAELNRELLTHFGKDSAIGADLVTITKGVVGALNKYSANIYNK